MSAPMPQTPEDVWDELDLAIQEWLTTDDSVDPAAAYRIGRYVARGTFDLRDRAAALASIPDLQLEVSKQGGPERIRILAGLAARTDPLDRFRRPRREA